MKILLIFLSISFSQQAFSNCQVNAAEKFIKKSKLQNFVKVKRGRHKLVFSEESCGSHGCEVLVFTDVGFGCEALSLDVKAGVPSRPFQGGQIRLSLKEGLVKFRYDSSRKKFVRAR